MRIALAGKLGDLRPQHLRDGMFVCGVRHRQHSGNAGQLRGLRCNRCRVRCQHNHIDGFGRDRQRSAQRLGGGRIELTVEMFGNNENLGHYSNPFCLSAATSSAASLTITPRLRLDGAA